jgi:glutathione peroxidase
MTFYDFTINSLNGQPFNLDRFRGKKVVVVNVASECGLTPQYTELEHLNKEYKDAGVAFIGVPCNDFGGQEPGTADEIQNFCSVNYGVTFPLTEKVHTVGEQIHPLYQWLTAETGEEVTWNFQKFLIDEEGKVVKSIAPSVTPTDPQLTDWLNHGSTAN